MRTLILRLFVILLLLGLAACGGSEVGDPTQIFITDSRDGGSTSDAEITIGGTVDKTGITTDPGFVTWTTGGDNGVVPVTVVCFIICQGQWKATVPLNVGMNTITATYFGVSDSMTITRFLAFNISGNARTQAGLALKSPEVKVTRTDAALSAIDALLDDKGNYEYTVVVPGTYTITPKLAPVISPSCLSFNPPSRIVDVTVADVSGQDFVATHPTPCYSIRGGVFLFGFGFSGIKVTLEDTNGNVISKITDNLGRYEIQWLLPGTYTITPSNFCCGTISPTSKTVTIVNADLVGQDFTLISQN